MRKWNNKAAVGPGQIVVIVIAFFVLAVLGTIALNQLFIPATDPAVLGGINSSVNATVRTVATTVVGILFAIGCAIAFIPRGKGGMAFSPVLFIARILEKLKRNKRAGVGISFVIAAATALLVFAYLAPIALNYLAVAPNATRVSGVMRTVWITVTSILFVIAVAIRFIPRKG